MSTNYQQSASGVEIGTSVATSQNQNKSSTEQVAFNDYLLKEEITIKKYQSSVNISNIASYVIHRNKKSLDDEYIYEHTQYFINTHPITKDTSSEINIEDLTTIFIKQYKLGLYTPKTFYINYSDYSKPNDIFYGVDSLFVENGVITKKSSSTHNYKHSETFDGFLINAIKDTIFNSSNDLTVIDYFARDSLEKMYEESMRQMYTPEKTATSYIILAGVVTTIKTMKITIINTDIKDSIVEDVIAPAHLGIEILSPIKNSTIKAESSFDIIVKIYPDKGQLSVFDFFTLKFSNGQTLKIFIQIFRQASAILYMVPDKNSYKESYQFKTIIFKSLAGVESRKALMDKPKISTSYTVTINDAMSYDEYRNIIMRGIFKLIWQPLWSFTTQLTQDAINTTELFMDLTNFPIEIGDYIAIYRKLDECILLKVIEIKESSVVVNIGVDYIKKGAIVTRAFKGILPNTLQTQFRTQTSHKLNIEVYEL